MQKKKKEERASFPIPSFHDHPPEPARNVRWESILKPGRSEPPRVKCLSVLISGVDPEKGGHSCAKEENVQGDKGVYSNKLKRNLLP